MNDNLLDHDFLTQFESLSLDPSNFDHTGHVRLTWLYLKEYPLDIAIEKVCQGIKRYAEYLGAPDKFHLTMTDAFVKIINDRLLKSPNLTFIEFIQANPDLIEQPNAILSQYFSSECINSTNAKKCLVAPDKHPLPK